MAVTMLLLMPFARGEPLLHIFARCKCIDANVMQGIWQMTRGDPLTASFVLFALQARRLFSLPIAYLWFGNILGMNLRSGADAGKAQRVGDARYLSCGYRRRVN